MKCKKRNILIVFGIIIVLFGCFLFFTDYLVLDEESRLLKEKLKKQNELRELINIDTISNEFVENYFQEVKQIEHNDKENILIVVSKKEIDNTYGAKDVIEAPNNQYFLIYDSNSEKDNAFDKLNNNNDVVSVANNDIFYAEIIDGETISYNSWGVDMLGYNDAISRVNEIAQVEPNRIKDVVVAIIDTGLYVDIFNENYPDKLIDTYDIIVPDDEMVDSDGHGTHIAGTIAESTPSNVKIISVKASDSDRNKTGDEGSFYTIDLINAINYIVNGKKADVISFSIGGPGSFSADAADPFYQAIESVRKSNIIFVTSAGNDNTDALYYPSHYDNTISVAAVDSHLEKTQFSNYGKAITFSAPGYKIKSINLNSSGVIKSGTSMATPHVSAAVSILKSFNKDLTLADTISLLKKHAIDIGDDGFDIFYGNGVVNFNGAVFCNQDVVCDEYNVFEDNDINTLKINKIESNGKYISKYNYGSITNIVDAEINLYYTEDDYYTKTLSQLINNIEIIGYDPYDYSEQDVVIKYNGLETVIKIDNKNLINGWEYLEMDNKIYLNDMFIDTYTGNNQTYSQTYFPQVIYVPSKIGDKDIYSINDNFFMNVVNRADINVKRFLVSSGIKNIGKSVFSINYNTYSVASNNKSYYKLPFLEVVLPDSIEYIDDSAFKMEKTSGILESRSNMLFYVYKDSYAHSYAIDNKIDYLYIDNVDINLGKKEYYSFDMVDLDDLSIVVNYEGSVDGRSEVIDTYTLKYSNDNDGFRYGDNSFLIEFDTKTGYHIEKEVSVVVNKIVPEYEIPTGLNGIIGQRLSEIELPLNFEWMNLDQVIEELGEVKFKVKYVPNDTDNYEIVEDIDVVMNVTDGKEILEPKIIVSDKIYDGTDKIDLDSINIYNLNDGEYIIEDTVLSDINVGEVIANVKLKLSDEKYLKYKFLNGLQEMNFEVNIKIIPEKLVKPTLVDKEYIYNKIEQDVELNNFDENKMNISGNKRTNAGEQDVVISLKNSNYVWSDGTTEDVILKFRINKAVLSVKDETVTMIFLYDEKNHSIDIKLVSEEEILIKYMNQYNEYVLDEIPKYNEVGEYIIKYKVFIDDNYTEYYGESCLMIVPKEISKPSLVDKKYIYNGSEQVVELNNFDSNIMNIFGNKRTNIGEQDVVISLKNSNYVWNDGTTEDVILKFRIDKEVLPIKDETKNISVVYDGKYHSIDIRLVSDKDIVVKYMNQYNEYVLDEIPKYNEVGEYIIKYKVFIDDNYTEYYGERKLQIVNNSISNNTIDYETFYDGKYHSIDIDIDLEEYDIEYSVNSKDYNLNELPKFKDVGEYVINYKITANGYDVLFGSNKVRIYGIKSIDSSLKIKENIFVIKDNDLKNIKNKIEIYSKSISYKLYNSKNELINNNYVNTGDYIRIILNDSNGYKFGVSVLGDINGDGNINSADLLRIRQHLLKTIELKDSYYFASDVNDDSIINSADLLRIRQHLLGIKPIN